MPRTFAVGWFKMFFRVSGRKRDENGSNSA
jgi:hypothetical protein